VALIEVQGKFYLREAAAHFEALAGLLAEFEAAGVVVSESRSFRGEWARGSWTKDSVILRLTPSTSAEELRCWKAFFARPEWRHKVHIDFCLRAGRS
jgi:hypothetical protein